MMIFLLIVLFRQLKTWHSSTLRVKILNWGDFPVKTLGLFKIWRETILPLTVVDYAVNCCPSIAQSFCSCNHRFMFPTQVNYEFLDIVCQKVPKIWVRQTLLPFRLQCLKGEFLMRGTHASSQKEYCPDWENEKRKIRRIKTSELLTRLWVKAGFSSHSHCDKRLWTYLQSAALWGNSTVGTKWKERKWVRNSRAPIRAHRECCEIKCAR